MDGGVDGGASGDTDRGLGASLEQLTVSVAVVGSSVDTANGRGGGSEDGALHDWKLSCLFEDFCCFRVLST